jgi:pimeloyl-ACP methyl ester carboxylesterase
MAVFSGLRAGGFAERAVIMSTVVPGVEPWEEVLANPYIWHFPMHSVPDLPELLVQGHQRAYFDFFYDVLTPDPSTISDEIRDAAAAAYATDAALRAGFEWYRRFPDDVAANTATAGAPITTPLLYVRGEAEPGDIDVYVAGFRAAGVTEVSSAVVPAAGHFAMLDAPAEVWRSIAELALT